MQVGGEVVARPLPFGEAAILDRCTNMFIYPEFSFDFGGDQPGMLYICGWGVPRILDYNVLYVCCLQMRWQTMRLVMA